MINKIIKKDIVKIICAAYILFACIFYIDKNFAEEIKPKYYVIKNPRTKIERIVDDDGNVLLKTNETEDDYEQLFIIYEEVGGREFFVKRINTGSYEHTWELYNNRGEYIEKGEGWGPYIKDGYLYPDADNYFEINYEFGITTPSGRKIKLFNDADLNNKESRNVSKNKVDDPRKETEIKTLNIDKVQVEKEEEREEKKNDVEEVKKNIEEQKEKSNVIEENDDYRIINAGDHYEYYSKRSNLTIKDVDSYVVDNYSGDPLFGRRIDDTYVVTRLNSKGKFKYVTYSQNYGYDFFEDNLIECENMLVFREHSWILNEGHITVVCEYGDTPYSLKELIKEKYEDVNTNNIGYEIIFYAKEKPRILYTKGKIDYIFYIPNKTAYAVEKINEGYYKLDKVNIIDLKTFEVSNDYRSEGIFAFQKGKNGYLLSSLLKDNMKLLYYDIKKDYFKELRTKADYTKGIESLHSKYQKTCIVFLDGKYKVVDKNGKILIDDLQTDENDEPMINKKVLGNTDAMFNVTNKKGTFVFDENGKVLFSGLKKEDVIRSGNYYLVFKGNAYNIYYKDGTKLVENVDCNKYNYNGQMGVHGSRVYSYEDLKELGHKNLFKFFDDHCGHMIVYDKGKAKIYANDGKVVDKNFKYIEPFHNEYESNIRNLGEGGWNRTTGHTDDYFVYVEGFKFGLMDFNGVKKFEFSIFDDSNED